MDKGAVMEFSLTNIIHAKKQLERAVNEYKADTDEAPLKCYATIALYHEVLTRALDISIEKLNGTKTP